MLNFDNVWDLGREIPKMHLV